jgi:uncharacterized protein YgbK (DUF1537 family)
MTLKLGCIADDFTGGTDLGALAVGQLVVAGGETSGAGEGRGLHLALKSGNFGGMEFFRYVFDRL